MWVKPLILRHIIRLGEGAIFCAREMMNYGPRPSIYQTLWRMVKKGEIVRLAYGLYTMVQVGQRLPSKDEIVQARLSCFARESRDDIKTIAARSKLAVATERTNSYETDSSGTAFTVLDTNRLTDVSELMELMNSSDPEKEIPTARIYVRRRAARKLLLGDDPIGQAILSLWSLGQKGCEFSHIVTLTSAMNADQRNKFHLAKRWMPGWLHDKVFMLRSLKYVNMARRPIFAKASKLPVY